MEQKDLTQWFLRITAYGDELLQDLQKLEGGWPDRVLSMQRNWIGKSTGAAVRFGLPAPLDGVDHLEVFTTRPDTVFGVTFLTLAPEHPLVEKLIEGYEKADEVRAFVTRIRNMDRLERQSDNLEKEGIFTGAYVIHPFTGQQVPVWLGNFVLADYGTGAVMGVPAHDQRDFEFARKYGLAPYTMFIGSGALWGETILFSMCILEEMQWKRTRSITSHDFFHGTLELLEPGVPVVLFKGEDECRVLDNRVEAFLRSGKTGDEDYLIIDTAEYAIPGLDDDFRVIVSPWILSSLVTDRMAAYYETVTKHNLKYRRYYHQFDY